MAVKNAINVPAVQPGNVAFAPQGDMLVAYLPTAECLYC